MVEALQIGFRFRDPGAAEPAERRLALFERPSGECLAQPRPVFFHLENLVATRLLQKALNGPFGGAVFVAEVLMKVRRQHFAKRRIVGRIEHGFG